MKKSMIWCIVLFGLAVIVSGLVSAQTGDVPVLARVDLSNAAQAHDLLTRVYDLPVYAHLQDAAGRDYALVIAPQARLEQSGLSYRILDADTRGGEYVLALERRPGARASAAQSVNVLYDDGRHVILRATPAQAEGLAELGFELQWLDAVPLTWRAPVAPGAPQTFISNSVIAGMVSQVQPSTVYTYDGLLSGEWPALVGGAPYTFTTRHTASGTPIQKATQYVYEHLQALSLTVGYHNWAYGGTSGRNVIGVLTGTLRPDEIVLVTAHLDDMPSTGRAPGADDNASGSTGVLIAADILSRYRFERTLRFIFFTGEEQGMYGSQQYATLVSGAGENIVAVYNLDMIAWNSTTEPTLRLHTRTAADPGYPGDLAIAGVFTQVVSAYGLSGYLTPIIDPDGLSFSDHSSFWNRGYPALLAIEDDVNDWNATYHTSSDRLATLDLTYFTNYIKASVGTVAHLAYPITPIIVPLASVALSGRTLGLLSATLTFAAVASPVTATLPITFVWNATDQTPVTHVLSSLQGSSDLSDTAVYSWTAAGTQAITVTATNVSGTVTDTHLVTLKDAVRLYLPLVLRSYAPVRAGFYATPTSGWAPLTVVFTNTSTGNYTSTVWNLGDGVTTTLPSPTHSYTRTGAYTVTLAVSSLDETDTLTRANYITVSEPPLAADFITDPTSGLAPLTVIFTNTSTGVWTFSVWDFGDGITSTQPSPTHTYAAAGVYTAALTISNGAYTDTASNTIVVRAGTDLIVNGGFEADTAWTFGTTATPAVYTDVITHTGRRSARAGVVPPMPDANSYSSVYQRVTVPVTASRATLSFWYWPRREGGTVSLPRAAAGAVGQPIEMWRAALAQDTQYALLLDSNLSVLQTLVSASEDRAGWQFATYALPANYAGRTLYVYFDVFNNGDAVENKRAWMYVDDVSLVVQ